MYRPTYPAVTLLTQQLGFPAVLYTNCEFRTVLTKLPYPWGTWYASNTVTSVRKIAQPIQHLDRFFNHFAGLMVLTNTGQQNVKWQQAIYTVYHKNGTGT